MPALYLVSAVFVFDQAMQWKYGAIFVIGLLLLSVGVRAQPQDSFLEYVRAASRTTELASWMAGRKRARLREEWAAILAGDPENDLLLSPVRKMRYAFGFVKASLVYRLTDLAAPLWHAVDWALSMKPRTNTLLAFLVGMQAVYIADAYGIWAATCCSIYCLIALRTAVYLLCRMRGIEPGSTSPRKSRIGK
ncbi:hypothetical protein HLK59_16220 [Streptomyces sp. S3(2020)]|uniref:hypothetical protein n=1 Tax=Streptomyces sp. S3(2020) TaxID=2732044 RepID=UPI001488F400|nr:hypothetical protein [Streptomyces sp. S3(2020)]NNN31885.1 hypothetical protein [Streptomyces sp. S3(2020)]